MKNIIKYIVASTFIISSLALAAAAKDSALVVKQDGRNVYLDISDFKNKPKADDGFRIIEEGEPIINPKTGKNLGKEIVRQINGSITQVEENFAIGLLEKTDNVLGLEAEVQVTVDGSLSHTAFKETQKNAFEQFKIPPAWQAGAPIDGETKAAAAGDITGDGQNELILSFEEDNSINAFTLEGDVFKKLASVKVNPLRKIVSLDAADLKGIGAMQIFATVYDSSANKLTTMVFEYKESALTITGTVNGAVKGISPNGGKRVLYTQDISKVSNNFTLTTPARLLYEDGAFKTGEKLTANNFKLIYGFNHGKVAMADKAPVIYTTTTRGRLRLQFNKRNRFIESPPDLDFSTTPNRIKYKNDLVRLYTSVALNNVSENTTIITAVEHTAKLGLLADTFGSYSGAKLHMLKWDGNVFTKQAQADIGGVVYDIIQAPLGKYEQAIIVPFTTGTGKTSVMIFEAGQSIY
jgi:hypothetical protein